MRRSRQSTPPSSGAPPRRAPTTQTGTSRRGLALGRDALDPLARPEAPILRAFAVALVALAPSMLPVAWTGNAMHSFDLGLRFGARGRFGAYPAVFDSLTLRAVGLYAVGDPVLWLGMSAALAWPSR